MSLSFKQRQTKTQNIDIFLWSKSWGHQKKIATFYDDNVCKTRIQRSKSLLQIDAVKKIKTREENDLSIGL